MAEKGVELLTKPFRVAFPVLGEPQEYDNDGKPKWSINMLFDKDTDKEAVMELRKALYEAAQITWGPDRKKWPSPLNAIDFKTYLSPNNKDGFPLRDGDTVTWDGFPGHFFLKATKAAKDSKGNRQKPPVLMDKTRTPILDPMDVEGGLICRARLYIKGYETPKAKGIGVYLNGLQVLKDDGTRFSGSGADFEEWEDEEAGSGFDDSNF